jgi:hypothetical protein
LGSTLFPENAPGIMAFDRAVVSVKQGFGSGTTTLSDDIGGDYYLDPTSEINGYPVDRTRLVRTTLMETSRWKRRLDSDIFSEIALSGNLEIDKENIKGDALIELTGRSNPYWKNLENENAIEDVISKLIPIIGLKIENTHFIEIERYYCTRVNVKFTSKPKEDDHIVRILPETKAILPDLDPRVASTSLPVRLAVAKVSIKWAVKGAGKGEPLELKPVQKAGELSVVRTPSEEGFVLQAKMDIKDGVLQPTDYPAFQAAFAAWQNPVVAGVLLP